MKECEWEAACLSSKLTRGEREEKKAVHMAGGGEKPHLKT